MFGMGYFLGLGSSFSPASLALTGWWRVYGGSPWVGLSSAGPSGGRNLTESTNPPSTNTLNGYSVIDCDGLNDILTSPSLNAPDFLTNATGFIACLFYGDAANAPAADAYDDEAMVTDGAGRYALAFSTAGIRAVIYNGTVWKNTDHVTCATGNWHWAFAWWANQILYCQLDANAPSSIALGADGSLFASPLRICLNWGSNDGLDGKIAEVMTASTDLSSKINNIIAYGNARYGLSLGVSTAFNPTSLSLTGFWRNYTGSSPWVGVASAGTSTNQNLTEGTNPPSAGTALNGYGVAHFDGTNDTFTYDDTLDTYINAKAASGWVLFKWDSTGANSEFLIGPNANDSFTLAIQTTPRVIINVNGGAATVNRAITGDTWQVVTWRYDGVNLQIGVNENPGAAGGGSTIAFSTDIANLTDTLKISETTLGAVVKGDVAEMGISDTAISDANFTNIRSYINTRYGLSL